MNLMRYKWWYLIFSAVITIPGLIALGLWGLRLGIDFTGGSLTEAEIPGVNSETLRSRLEPLSLGEIQVQESGETRFLIRTPELSREAQAKLQAEIAKTGGTVREFQAVDAAIGQEITRKAFYLVGFAALMIVLYIAWAFRQVPQAVSSWQFGGATVVALIHDVLVVTGVFALLGHFAGVEIDALFVTALLTVIGFSVHDSIVVFDRIRENLRRRGSDDFEQTVNDSIVQTLARSINTSLTVLLALLALYLFGGESIKTFVLALLIGIASGTYSSIFNATPVLVIWQEWKERRR